MAITFLALVAYIVATTLVRPQREPARQPEPEDFDATPSRSSWWAGGAIVAATAVLYLIFW